MYASGKFPLGIQSVKLKSDKIDLPKIDDKVNEMVEFERKLYKNNSELKRANKKQRKRMIKELQQGRDISSSMRRTDDLAAPAKKKRRSLPMTPSEKAKVNKWQEDDIEVPSPLQPKSADESTVVAAKKRKSIDAVAVTEKLVTKEKKSKIEKQQQHQDDDQRKSPKSKKVFAINDEWSTPLADGEIEYTIPSRKLKLAQLNAAAADIGADASPNTTPMSSPLSTPKCKGSLVLNPVAAAIRGKQMASAMAAAILQTPPTSTEKRVTIKLNMNRSQDTSEYVRQLRSSPNVPYDSNKKPTKSLLKPNLMPSPINPYYKKKIGLNFD